LRDLSGISAIVTGSRAVLDLVDAVGAAASPGPISSTPEAPDVVDLGACGQDLEALGQLAGIDRLARRVGDLEHVVADRGAVGGAAGLRSPARSAPRRRSFRRVGAGRVDAGGLGDLGEAVAPSPSVPGSVPMTLPLRSSPIESIRLWPYMPSGKTKLSKAPVSSEAWTMPTPPWST
jgi:hypothetical protein